MTTINLPGYLAALHLELMLDSLIALCLCMIVRKSENIFFED